MSNVGDFAVQNPIVCRFAQMWNGEWGMWNEGDFAVQNPIV